MRPMTRRSFAAVTLPVLGAAFSCSFGDDEEEDDKPNDKPVERRPPRDARAAWPGVGADTEEGMRVRQAAG